MDGYEHEKLSDQTLEREIESALAADPSPELVARIRSRLAGEPVRTSWPFGWRVASAGALVAGVAVLMMVDQGKTRETTGRVREPVAAARADGTPPTAATPTPRQEEPARTVARSRRVDRASRPVDPAMAALADVLIPESEKRGFGLFLAELREGREFPILTAAALAGGSPGPPWLGIDPVVIEPFPQLATPEGEGQ